MAKFIQKPKSQRSLEQLPDGTVVYAVLHNDDMAPVRYLISDSVPGMERMVRPETDFYHYKPLVLHPFTVEV